jgi:hypothetical protein
VTASAPGNNTPRRNAKPARHELTQALADPVRAVAQKAAGGRSLGEASLLTEWRAIVGDDIADMCWPRRLTFPRKGERREGTLILRVKPGRAPTVGHQEWTILERVNAYFGYKVAAGMRLEHGALPKGRANPAPAPPRALSPTEADAVTQDVADVGDADLRDALARLGKSLRASSGPASTE